MSFTRGSTATLLGEYTDGTGAFVDPVTPLVSILDPSAVVVVADAVPTRTSLGHYSYDFSIAADAPLGTWIARWSGTIGGVLQTGDDEFEVTAGAAAVDPYVALSEIRALPNLADTARFTDAELTAAREWFETTFEDYVGMAFVPRTATERLTPTGTTLMLRRWPVRSITAVRSYTTATASTVFTAVELADLLITGTGIRRYSLGYWPADVEVDYVHGQAAPPADVKQAALVAIQEKLLENNSGRPTDRTYGTATDGVFIRSINPDGDKHPFGIASVDAVAVRYRAKYNIPAVA